MTVSTNLAATITAKHVIAMTKLGMLATGRFMGIAAAGMLSGNISEAKQLLDPTHVLKDPEKFVETYHRLCAVQGMASVVFAYSIVEASFCDVLSIIFEHDPTSLDSILAGKQVSLADVSRVGLVEVKKEAFAKYLSEFEGMGFSIKKKALTLLSILKPATTTDVIKGFTFQVDELDTISERRHNFVHHADLSHLGNVDEQVEPDVEYLGKTIDFFFELLMRRVCPSSGSSTGSGPAVP